MAATPTRTLNPLPFGDLEPHRFEDMVRQLAYEFRRWRSLEATGRLGADGGIDIRGIEIVSLETDPSDGEDDEAPTPVAERLWVFQCKREKTLPPTRMRKVLKETLGPLQTPPHGFVLAVACDVSAAARTAFRTEMARRNIEEFFIWGKSDLEDMLFQPKNDRLLFAYFGIALRPRRRAATTVLRSEIAKRKQLASLLGEEADHDGVLVLVRDPADERYPFEPKVGEPPARWFLCRAVSIKKPRYLVVLRNQHLAAVSRDGEHWDAILDFDLMMWHAQTELQSNHAWAREAGPTGVSIPHAFWNEYIDEARQAYLQVHRAIPLERILAIDSLGDGPYPVPHLLAEFADLSGPFTPRKSARLVLPRRIGEPIDVDADEQNRVEIFPNPVPGEDDPAPAAFDDTDAVAQPLQSEIAERLSSLLPAAVTREAQMNGRPTDGVVWSASSDARLIVFQKWCDAVARPALSTVVVSLRRAGHRARLILRPAREWEYASAVEIRIKLQAEHYFPEGRVLISCMSYAPEWRVEIVPAARDTQSRHQTPPTVPTVSEKTSIVELQALVVTAIERMKAGA